MRYIILWLFGLNYSMSSLSLPNFSCQDYATFVFACSDGTGERWVSGLAAVVVLNTCRREFGLGFSISKWSGLNCLSSFPSGILALAVPGLVFKLKVFSALACASLHFVSTASPPYKGDIIVGNHIGLNWMHLDRSYCLNSSANGSNGLAD